MTLHVSQRHERKAKFKVLDLFSGIGGFSLGLERTGGFETVAFCEIDPFCRRVLAKHWPKVKQYDDVRTLTADTLRRDGIAVDVICGGFPCQDISPAGKRTGLKGERSGLVSEAVRLIEQIEPEFFILENSIELVNNGLASILREIHAIGYNAIWQPIPAASVGARHLRKRLWVVGFLPNTKGEWIRERWWIEFAKTSDQRRSVHIRFNEPEPQRVADGVPRRMDRIRTTGNAVVPQIPELIGRAILETQETFVKERQG